MQILHCRHSVRLSSMDAGKNAFLQHIVLSDDISSCYYIIKLGQNKINMIYIYIYIYIYIKHMWDILYIK
jgi:hypothetical protein